MSTTRSINRDSYHQSIQLPRRNPFHALIQVVHQLNIMSLSSCRSSKIKYSCNAMRHKLRCITPTQFQPVHFFLFIPLSYLSHQFPHIFNLCNVPPASTLKITLKKPGGHSAFVPDARGGFPARPRQSHLAPSEKRTRISSFTDRGVFFACVAAHRSRHRRFRLTEEKNAGPRSLHKSGRLPPKPGLSSLPHRWR